MSSLRILQTLPELGIGGVERATLDMVMALRQNFSETFVSCHSGVLLPELEKLGGTHFSLPLNRKNPLQIMRNGLLLAQLIKDHNIHLIHARSRGPAWSSLLAAKLTKIPFITTYHAAYNSTNIVKNLYNSVMARGDRVISISKFISTTIEQHHPKAIPNVRLIREGIDLDTFDPKKVSQQEIQEVRTQWNIPPSATVFLLPGRITRLKGQAIFVDAIRRLDNPNIIGVILGDNHELSSYPMEVRNQAEGLPIRIVPHTTNPRIAYAASDCIVYPSLAQEAFGRVTAEAGAMERIVIATNHGATPEICKSSLTGYLVPPGDSRALAQTMMSVLTMSRDDFLKMGNAARAHIAANFSLNRMCTETINLYQELIS
jgi:glycosyltransferase involved in cell wall biosynthesis